MNKTEFIAAITDAVNEDRKDRISKAAVRDVIEAAMNIITDQIANDSDVTLTGFGKFSAVQRSEREGTDPRTGEKMHIAARRAAKFKPGKALAEAVK